MDIRVNFNIRSIKANWRRYVYILAGMAIAGILVFAVFRSLFFLGSQMSSIFQLEDSSQFSRPKFDLENFEKIKDWLK